MSEPIITLAIKSELYNYHDPKTHSMLKPAHEEESPEDVTLFRHLTGSSYVKDTTDTRYKLEFLAKLHSATIVWIN